MTQTPLPLQASDLHGLSLLAVDGVNGVTDLVEDLHHAILRPPGFRAVRPEARTGGIPGFVYRSIRGVTGLVGKGLNLVASPLVPRLATPVSSSGREQFLAILNGVLGDHLARSSNPLAIPSSLRRDGQPLTLDAASLAEAWPNASNRLLVTAHGLCMHDSQWRVSHQPEGLDSSAEQGEPGFGGLPEHLATACGYSTIDFHYNTGQRIVESGRAFSDLLERLVAHWPTEIEELTVLSHSMGGLVTRSAVLHGVQAGHIWPWRLNNIVFLGTPHHGSPVERAGHLIDRALGFSRYSAPFARLGKVRSAGITDLRHGNITAAECFSHKNRIFSHDARDDVVLPGHIECFAIAATLDDAPDSQKSRHIGDGLVPVPSALGQHENPQHQLPIPQQNQFVATQTGHMELLRCPTVAQKIVDWLE